MNESIKKLLIDKRVKSIGDIQWAHAVNNVKYLEQALADSNVDFLEIDISLSINKEPVAAHYSNESDLTFVNLLNSVKQSEKGLKLDFNDQGAVSPCVQLLGSANLNQPIILNADILSARDAPPAIIQPQFFTDTCSDNYPDGQLSLGWRTTENSTYTAEDIREMVRICRDLNSVTFPVRASILPHSWKNVKSLLQKEKWTLTIFNSRPLDSELLDWIKQNTDPQKCFYDFTVSRQALGMS
jgi:hypothetical protein